MPKVKGLWDLGLHEGSKWMMFVDGEGFTIRAQHLAKEYKAEIPAGSHHLHNAFLWPQLTPVGIITDGNPFHPSPVRSYYYTSLSGDTDKLNAVRTHLWNLGFHPEVFPKEKQSDKAKGVDITLTKDMLTHAFHNNYDVAVVVAGDADFVPLINEVKRMGKTVCVAFMETTLGLSPKLVQAADFFIPLDKQLLDRSFVWPQLQAIHEPLQLWWRRCNELVRTAANGYHGYRHEIAARLGSSAENGRFAVVTNIFPTANEQMETFLRATGFMTHSTAGMALHNGILMKSDRHLDRMACAQLIA